MRTMTEQSAYEQARARLHRKRKFRGDLAGFIAVNAFLVGIWAVSGFGYFWPAWVMAVWGFFLVLDAWNVFYRGEITEEDIQRELHRTR